MAEQAEKSEQGLDRICARLKELEIRVATLEKRGELSRFPPEETFLGTAPIEKEKRAGLTSAVPVLGKAVLVIAGAYLLRAVAESGAVPRWMMLVAGMVYAGAWLAWAVRAHRTSHFASVIFALTAAVILPPLLWEGTVRFHALTSSFASVVLVGAVVLPLGLAWRERLEGIPWIGTVAAVGTALVLIIATHELRAFTTALLAMAFVMEAAAACGRWLSLRVVTAVAADFAVGLLGLVMASAEGVPESYRAMSPAELNAYCIALMVIYGGSMGVRAFVLQKNLTFVEVGQAALAFALGTWVSLRATNGASSRALGAAFLLLAVACYWGVLRRFSATEMRRNQRVSAIYASGLVLAGSLLLLNGNYRTVALSLAAGAAAALFTRTNSLSLGIHGTLYLLAAAIVGGVFEYAARALAGNVPSWPEWGFCVVAVSGLVSYMVGSRGSGEGWRARILWVLPATVAGSAAAALAVAGIVALGSGELNASRLSMVRTAVTSVTALGFGYAGSRWNRLELVWLSYGAIGLGALKLLAEDLRFGSAGTLMVSLLFYGLILILLPRLTRFGRVEV